MPPAEVLFDLLALGKKLMRAIGHGGTALLTTASFNINLMGPGSVGNIIAL